MAKKKAAKTAKAKKPAVKKAAVNAPITKPVVEPKKEKVVVDRSPLPPSKVRYKKLRNQMIRASRADRLQWFLDQLDTSDRDYWECLRDVYIDQESLHEERGIWKTLFNSRRHGRDKWLMTKEEAKFLNELPPVVKIYRGCASDKITGISWSTDRKKALWFANRFNHKQKEYPFELDCYLVEGEVKKEHILAVFHSRGEFEVVVDPKNIKKRTNELVKPTK